MERSYLHNYLKDCIFDWNAKIKWFLHILVWYWWIDGWIKHNWIRINTYPIILNKGEWNFQNNNNNPILGISSVVDLKYRMLNEFIYLFRIISVQKLYDFISFQFKAQIVIGYFLSLILHDPFIPWLYYLRKGNN